MTKEELKELLSFLTENTDNIGLSMYLIVNSNEQNEVKRADISEDVIEELKEMFISSITNRIVNDESLAITNISRAQEKIFSLYIYDLEEKPPGINILKTLLDNEDCPLFNFRNDNLQNVTGFVFLLGNAEHRIAIYKKQYPISLLRRDSVLMYKVAERIEVFDGDILKLNDSFDFIQVEDNLLIYNLNTLERFFGFNSVIENIANKVINKIENSQLLSNVSLLKELIKEARYAKKLMKVNQDSPVLEMEFDKIKRFVTNHPILKDRILLDEENSQFNIETKVAATFFLKLLDDDFLKSELTDFLYESEVKDKLN